MNTPTFRLLYAGDNQQDADLARLHLQANAPDMELTFATTGARCLELLRIGQFDAVLVEHHLRDATGLLQRLALQHRHLPVVVLTAAGDDETAIKVMRAGASDYVPKSGDYLATLPGLLRELAARTQAKEKAAPASTPPVRRVLYMEPDEAQAQLTQVQLAAAAPHLQLTIVRNCTQAVGRLLESRHGFDLVVADLRSPGMGGLEFLHAAKRHGFSLPILVHALPADEETAAAALRLGACDYVVRRERHFMQLAHIIDRVFERAELEADRRRVLTELEAATQNLEQAVQDRTAALRQEIAEHQRAGNERAQAGIEQALAEAAGARAEAERTRGEAEFAKIEAEFIKAEAESAKAEAERARAEAELAKAEAERAKGEADLAKAEVEYTKAEAEHTRVEAESAKAEAQQAKVEAEQAKAAAERARGETEAITSGAEKTVRSRSEGVVADAGHARLASIIEATSDFVSIASADHGLLFINRAGRRMLGVGEDEDLSQSSLHACLPDWAFQRLRTEAFPAAARTGSWSGETALLSRDGREIPVSQVILAHKGADGLVEFFSTIARDISERKQVEARTRAFASLGQRLSATLTLEEAGQSIVDTADALFGWDACTVDALGPGPDRMRPIIAMDVIAGRRKPVPVEKLPAYVTPLARAVVEHGAQLILREPGAAPAGPETVPFGATSHRSASLMLAPVRHGQRVVGLLSIQSYTVQAYAQRDMEVFQQFADFCGAALERIRAEEAKPAG